MDLVLDLLATVSRWSRSHLSDISLALIGCLLVLFGADFKGWVEQRLGSIAGALRVPLMALLCLVGSGAALIYATLGGARTEPIQQLQFGARIARGAGADWCSCRPPLISPVTCSSSRRRR